MKTRVLLDIDGVIADFYKEFARFLNEECGCTLHPDRVPENYSFDKWGHGVEHIDIGAASNAWIRQGGILNIPAFDGAENFVAALMSQCDVYIVTARVGDWERKLPPDIKDKIKNDTHKWLENHNIPTDRLFFSHKKVDFCQENNISIMIEDKLSTALEASKNGIRAVLVDRPYNGNQTNRFGIHRAHSFDEVLDRLRVSKTHTPYILKEDELEILLDGIVTRGVDETYEAMKARSLGAAQKIPDADEILMDQADTVLKRARNLEIKNEEDEELLKTLYKLHGVLRILSHEIYREYLKTDKERDNERFIRLVK